MKKALFILLFVLPCLAFAQKKLIDGFMDIPFGSDSATVKAALLAKGGIKIKNDTLSKKDILVFSNFSLSNRPVSSLKVYFVNNKAFDALFYFSYDDADVLYSYDNLVTDLTAIYGKPDASYNGGVISNTTKIRKIRAGNVNVNCAWISKNKNAISVNILPVNQTLMVCLRYEDGPLYDLDAAKRRSDL